MMAMVIERTDQPDCGHGYVLDGFPRTVTQAQRFDEHLAAAGKSIDFVIELLADRDLLIQRVLDRAIEQHRADDTQATLTARLEVYDQLTAPVVHHYANRMQIHKVDSSPPADDVFTTILDIVERR